MPAELLQFIEADELDYYVWRGYDNFRANPVEEYTQFGGCWIMELATLWEI